MPAPSPRVEAFLRLLTDRGMLRGVDRRLRIELALRTLGEPEDRRALHDLLVPLVARNREEQARFRELFDDFFGVGSAATRRSSTGIAMPPSPTPPIRGRTRRVPIAAVTLAALIAVALIWREPIRRLLTHRETRNDTIAAQPVQPPPSTGAAPSTPVDTLDDADAGLPAVAMQVPTRRVPGRIVGASFGSAAIIGLPMLLAAFGARRRRAVAYAEDDARKRTPPLVYTPKPPKPPLFMSAEFFDAVRVAVRRQRMDGNRISVERTIEATIAAGGLPTLRYEPASRPPEYLILIERASTGDHQALLFDAMTQRMRQEGVLYVERYFYERDPRLCRREQGGPTTIDELQRRFHEHRLVIFGDGDGLFDALSEAELAPWTSVFEAWNDRAILTATPVATWGAREHALGELFAMLPATPQGLREVVESFERGAAPDLKSWRQGEVERHWARRGQSDVRTLRASLDPRVWRWVCACAVYPNLHWALTLYLATLPELGGGELLREEHLLRLVALPWFRDGFMPAEVRAELVDELDESTERTIRRTLARLLELDPPDVNTAAGRWHEAQMFVQAVLANPDDEEVRAALEARVRTLPRALLLRDPSAARRLREVRHKRLDRLPKAARTILYRDGISLFGTRPWTRRTAGAATVLAVAVVPSFLWMRREPPLAKGASVASFAAPLRIQLPVNREFALEAHPRDAKGTTLTLPVTWAVADSGIANIKRDSGRTLVSGRRRGTTTLLMRAGGSEARIPIEVALANGPDAAVVVAMPAKRIRVGATRALPAPSTWTTSPSSRTGDGGAGWALSCDASVATATNGRAVQAQSAGTTRLLSDLGTSEGVEQRVLRVEANPDDTLAVLTAPINFARTSSQLSRAAIATLNSKVARMRTNPAIRLNVAIRETDASSTRVPLTIPRSDAIIGFFESSGIARDRIAVSAEALDYQSRDRYCVSPVLSNATFTPTFTPLIADRTTGTSFSGRSAVLSARPPVFRPDVRTQVAGSARPVASKSRRPATTPIRDSASSQGGPQASPIQKGVTQVPNQAIQAQQGPYQASNQASNAAPAAPSNLGVTGYGGTPRGAAGDAPETSSALQARTDLRDERLLKPAPADTTGAVRSMPAGTYAFASPNALIATIEKGDEKSLPAQARRTASADFEIHNVGGVSYIAAFVDPKVASALRSSYFSSLGLLELRPTAGGSASCPVEIPLSSLRSPKFVTSPAQALLVTIQPRTKDEPYIPRRVSGCPSGVQAN